MSIISEMLSRSAQYRPGFKLNGIRRLDRRRIELAKIVESRRELTNQFKTTLLTVLGGAFGFVAALSWNDAVKETINIIVPPEDTLFFKYLTALLITAISVLAIYAATKILKKETKV